MNWQKIEYDEDEEGNVYPIKPPPNEVEVLFWLRKSIYSGTYTYLEKGAWVEEYGIFVCHSNHSAAWQDFSPQYWTEYNEDGIEKEDL